MSDQHILDFSYILLFIVMAFVAGFAPFIISHWLRPARIEGSSSLATYECGIPPYGEAWQFRYGIWYYLYALIFLAFDVDILYLFPVAVAYDKVTGLRGVLELLIFLGILALAIVYAWAKGTFKWGRNPETL